MPRFISALATIAVVVAVAIGPAAAQNRGDATNGPCGYGEYAPCKAANDSCVLLSPEVLA